MFLDALEQSCFEKCQLDKNLPILVGVSGGSDSLALMEGLYALGFTLVVAHVDHALRPESHQEAEFVRHQAATKGVPFYSQRVDVRKFATRKSQSIEEAARNVRYQFLFDMARKNHCQAIAVGHHADDQVETLLMHFLRGAALPGLTGMPYRLIIPQWDRNIPLVRPLLNFWKDEIDAFVQSLKLTPCDDMSNLDLTYSRNRLRHELIPSLKTFNPQIKIVINRMAEILSEEEAYLDDLAKEAYEKCLYHQEDDQVSIEKYKFDLLSKALKRRVLRLAIEQLHPGLRDTSFETIQRGINLIEFGRQGERVDLVSNLEILLFADLILIQLRGANLLDLGYPLLPASGYNAVLFPGKSIQLRSGIFIEASKVETLPDDWLKLVTKLKPTEIWLDYDLLMMPLILRGRNKGDHFKPLGLGGRSQSLKEFFINSKIPAQIRAFWPLVTSNENIVWVAGLRPSEAYKITADTKKIIKIKIVSP